MDQKEYRRRAAFWSHVDIKIDDPKACWEWTASRHVQGYGFALKNRQGYRAHRMAYELAEGPIPEGAVVCHRCDNPGCCNPAHLFAATQKENMQDCIAKGRFNSKGPTGKLTPEQVQWIREQAANKTMTQREMGRIVGVGEQEICHILKGRRQRKN